tara:strand:+ start:271 stop:819 length:549 start_codon:yes stop_codon:yes gene_type:complete
MLYQILFIFIAILLFSCNDTNKVTTYKIKKPEAFTGKNISLKSTSNLNWTTPYNWIVKSKTDTRIASFNAPFGINSLADVSIIILSDQANAIEENINRWRKQINLDNSNLQDILNESLEYENSLGAFRSFKLLNNTTDEGILGAIIHYNNQSIFVKIKTSSIGVKELEYEFILFCKSLYWAD